MKQVLIVLTAAVAAGTAFAGLRASWGPDETPNVAAGLVILLTPAPVAWIGLRRDSRPLVIAAGALCVAPALMTGVLVIPCVGFLAIGGLDRRAVASNHELGQGVAVTVLGIASWLVPGLTVEPGLGLDVRGLGVTVVLGLATIIAAIGLPRRLPVAVGRST